MENRFTPAMSGPDSPSDQQPTSSQTTSSFNSFNNDGSFLERFKKMQEQKQNQSGSGSQTKSLKGATMIAASPAPTSSGTRVTKGGAVLMKLSGVKKTQQPETKLKKTTKSVKKAFGGDGSSSESEEEDTRGRVCLRACVCVGAL